MSVQLSKRAERDLDDIWSYIAQDDPRAADRVQDEIYAALALLGRHPRAGHTREDAGRANYRFWSVYSYLIVYRLHGRKVIVVRIVSGARDLRRLFRRK